MAMNAAALDAHRFTQAQCDALFAAVLINDEVDPHTELPEIIDLDFPESRLIDCFCLCRQLLKAGVDNAELVELTDRIGRDGDLNAEDRLRYKNARAKFKHMRFAYALYDARHRYPVILDWMTTAMGHMQDAMKNGDRRSLARQVKLARIFQSALPQRLVMREIDHFRPTTAAGYRGYVERQIAKLRAVLAKEAVTGEEFHATRKIISRQVSFYDDMRTIHPSPDIHKTARSLAAINGLMGEMHDRLVERRVAGVQDYHRERFALPDDIAGRLNALAGRYPAEATREG